MDASEIFPSGVHLSPLPVLHLEQTKEDKNSMAQPDYVLFNPDPPNLAPTGIPDSIYIYTLAENASPFDGGATTASINSLPMKAQKKVSSPYSASPQ